MPQTQRNRLIEWFALLKEEWLPSQRARMADWCEACREEPILIWRTPTIRYGVYGLGGLAGVWFLAWGMSLLEPAPVKDARPRADTANYHVVCGNPDCGHHFMITRKFGFNKFPVECVRCNQSSGRRATRCNSPACRGQYVAMLESDGEIRCGECGAVLGQAP